MIAKADLTVPTEFVLIRVLQDNGYNGLIGLNFLLANYGAIMSTPMCPELLFFCGVYVGRKGKVKLASNFVLKWHHYVRREPIWAGFFRHRELPEFERFQDLKFKLGAEVGLVGCLGHRDMCDRNLGRAAMKPPATWWIGVCRKGWLLIDLDFYLLDIYESLTDLLCERNGIELIAEI